MTQRVRLPQKVAETKMTHATIRLMVHITPLISLRVTLGQVRHLQQGGTPIRLASIMRAEETLTTICSRTWPYTCGNVRRSLIVYLIRDRRFFMEVIMADLEKVKEIVETIGLKAEEINDEIVEKVEAYKATLDTKTRRELRKVWGAISALCFALGYLMGWLF